MKHARRHSTCWLIRTVLKVRIGHGKSMAMALVPTQPSDSGTVALLFQSSGEGDFLPKQVMARGPTARWIRTQISPVPVGRGG